MMPIVHTIAILAMKPMISRMRPRMIMRGSCPAVALRAAADCGQEAPAGRLPEDAGTSIDVTTGRGFWAAS
jgi:hypothetical protein